MIKSQFREPKKDPQKPSEVQMFEMFAGKTLDEVKQMPNDERRELFSAYAKSKRKEETAKTIRPRYQVIKNESTGKVTRINVDTGEETVLREADSDIMKKNKDKEEAERIKQEKADAAKASSIYDRWLKAGRPPEDLRNLNVALEPFGYEVVEKLGEKNFLGLRGDTDYLYQKVGQVNKDPSQMSDEELAAEVARINRGQ